MNSLIAIARRALANRPISADTGEGNKGDKGEKPPTPTPFSPLSPLFHPATDTKNDPPARLSPVVLIVVDSSDRAYIGASIHADGTYSFPAAIPEPDEEARS